MKGACATHSRNRSVWLAPHRNAEQSHHEQPTQNPLKVFWRWTTHEPVAFYTAVLSLVTGLLVAMAFMQIRIMIRTDQTARLAANALPALERGYVFITPNARW